jgi:putative flavoprotein involved in K+ transport
MGSAEAPLDALVTIVGAGPTGLAVARELRRRRIQPLILERDAIAATWRALYPTLRLHTRRSAAHLPGLRYPPGDPFPTRDEVVAYLRSYARHHRLDVREATAVDRVDPSASPPARWRLITPHGTYTTRVLVWAAGIFAAPRTPALPGRGEYRGALLHVATYRTPEVLRDRRVLVIGGGNSGKDVALAALPVARSVTVAFRTPSVAVDYPNAFTQHGGAILRHLPPSLTEALLRRTRRRGLLAPPTRALRLTTPVVGFELHDAIAAGAIAMRPAVIALTPSGARFADGRWEAFDAIVFATGFAPATGPIAPYLHPDGTPNAPGLLVAGATYPTLGTFLEQLRREAPAVARAALAQTR